MDSNTIHYINGVCTGIELMFSNSLIDCNLIEYHSIGLNFFDTSKNSFEEELRKSLIKDNQSMLKFFKKDELERSISHENEIKNCEDRLKLLKNPFNIIRKDTDFIKLSTWHCGGKEITRLDGYGGLKNLIIDLLSLENQNNMEMLEKMAHSFSHAMNVSLNQTLGDIISIQKILDKNASCLGESLAFGNYHVYTEECYLINFKEGSILLTYGLDD